MTAPILSRREKRDVVDCGSRSSHSGDCGCRGRRGDAQTEAVSQRESQSDPEARFVRQLDRLDMALQAAAYTDAGHEGLQEFLDSADRFITEPSLRAILDALRAPRP